MKRGWIIYLSLMFAGYLANAQSIGGTISGENGLPLPGASVSVIGQGAGAISDDEGKYQFDLPPNSDSLICRFVGYLPQRKAIKGRSQINFTLQPEDVKVDKVVITALGIARDERELGYGYTKISPKSATENRDANFMNTLSGKVAGLQVTKTNGGPGASSRVLLRGVNSLKGENQPLFVVDGVPVNNSTRGSGGTWGGIDYGSPISDINPDDIEQITVLKGPNASALYGARAGNGAIVITTKKGTRRKGIGVSLNSNATLELPNFQRQFQNIYGAGNNGQFEYSPDGVPFFNTALEADSWGPKMEGQTYIDWDGEMRTFSPQPDNWKDFFRTGYTFTNAVSFQGGDGDSHFRLSYVDLRNRGTAPNTSFSRQNITFRGGTSISKRIKVDVKTNYVTHDALNRINQSDGRGAGRNFHFMPRNISLSSLQEYKDDAGQEKIWYSPWAWQSNPYWRSFEDQNQDTRDRLVGLASVNFDLTDWMSLTLRSGMDLYRDKRSARTATGSFANNAGDYSEGSLFFMETNSDILLQARHKFSDNFSLSGNIGGNLMNQTYEDEFAKAERLAIPHFYNVNFGEERPVFSSSRSRKVLNSVYGSAQLAYKTWAYLDLTARNDWSSSLPRENNSYFYPSANLSFVWSEALGIESEKLNFGKLRLSAAGVGNDTDPHQLDLSYISNGDYLGFPRNTTASQRPPSDLKPERISSYEAGLDLRMFGNRLNFDLNLYQTTTRNHILAADVAGSSGFSHALINAGETRSSGIEFMVRAEWLAKRDFSWSTSLNFSRNVSQVVELANDLENIQLASQWGITVEARPGNPYGDIVGIAIARDENGNRLLGDNGLYVKDGFQVLGNIQPDFMAGVSNTLQYKGVTLNFLVDIKYGGDMYAGTNMYGMGYSGNFVETLEGREEWYASEAEREAQGISSTDWEPTGGFLAEGNYAPGTVIDGQDVSGQPNQTLINPELYWAQFSNWGDELHEPHVYDASFVKLREVALAFNLPTAWTENIKTQRISVALVGRNLWLIHKNVPNIDPETFYSNGNGQGIEYGSYPVTRSFGLDIKFDW